MGAVGTWEQWGIVVLLRGLVKVMVAIDARTAGVVDGIKARASGGGFGGHLDMLVKPSRELGERVRYDRDSRRRSQTRVTVHALIRRGRVGGLFAHEKVALGGSLDWLAGQEVPAGGLPAGVLAGRGL